MQAALRQPQHTGTFAETPIKEKKLYFPWLCYSPQQMTSIRSIHPEERTSEEAKIGANISLTQIKFFMNLMNISVCLINLNGNIIHRSSKFSSEIGTPINLLEVVDLSDADRLYSAIKESLCSDDTIVRDLNRKIDANPVEKDSSEDNEVVIRWMFRRFPGQNFILVTCVDVVELKLKRAIKKEQSNALKALVHGGNTESEFTEKIRRITKRDMELRESQMKLASMEEVLEVKRTFVRYVSHEIRTPLSVVSSGLQMLRILDDDGEREFLEDIKSSCGIAIDILNDLLTYEKIDSNILSVQKSIINLDEIVKKTIRMFQVQARNSSISLTLSDDTSPSMEILVDADSAKIAQVLRNLVSNAMKFTPSMGSVDVRIKVDIETNRVTVQVQDTGPGITKENRYKLFNEIVQFNPATLQNGQGSGIGLFLTRRIVELHGGSIGVDLDWDGVGSIFYLELSVHSIIKKEDELPLITEEDTSSSEVGNSLSPTPSFEKLFPKQQSKLSVLLVDDVPMCRKLHRKILKPFCGTIAEACDGVEAVSKVEESLHDNKAFDVIFMDNSMPKMNGFEAAAKIRALGYDGKIFGVTGNAFQADIDDYLLSGANQVLVKPVSVEKFKDVIKDIVPKR